MTATPPAPHNAASASGAAPSGGATEREDREAQELLADAASQDDDGTGNTSDHGGAVEQDEAALPDWARAELSRARDEAARRRVELREMSAQLEGMSDPEEARAAIQLAHDRLAETEQQLTRERLGRTYNLPSALVDRIRGDDDEAMEADAKELAQLVEQAPRPPRPDPLQGGAEPAPLSAADRFAQILNARR